MDDRFERITASSELPTYAIRQLLDAGFVVIPGPIENDRFAQFTAAYDHAVAAAPAAQVRTGSTTTRVHGLLSSGPAFDGLCVYPPILEACCHVVGRPFKLSSLLARTVNPGSHAQPLHVDVRRNESVWPMLGFILMVDDFRADNGSTRFVTGSHEWTERPEDVMTNPAADHEQQVLACGRAGSLILYNASVWHGHSANRTETPRRSVQGAYVSREASSWLDETGAIRQETLDRIDAFAKYLLGA